MNIIAWFHIGAFIIYKTSFKISRECLVFHAIYGSAQFLAFTAGYDLVYAREEFVQNATVDCATIALGSGVFKEAALDWAARKKVHAMYPRSSLDPDRNYLLNFYQKKNIDVQRQLERVIVPSTKATRYQRKHYSTLSLCSGIIFPTLLCYLRTRKIKGSFVGSICRTLVVWHMVSLLNYRRIERILVTPSRMLMRVTNQQRPNALLLEI
jgi:fatty-acid desaturase